MSMKVKDLIESSEAIINIIVQEKSKGEVISTPELSTYRIRELATAESHPVAELRAQLLEIHKRWLDYNVKIITATSITCIDSDSQMYYDEPVILLIVDLMEEV